MSREIRVEIDGVELRSRLDPPGHGGPVVVLLHGFTGSAAAMEPLAVPLRRTHRVLSVDLVGHGGSAVPDDTSAYSTEAVARHLVGLFEALELGDVVLVGYSMGGRIALTLACSRPDLVAGLVTIGATAGLTDPLARAERRASDAALADDIERDGLEAFVDRWMALPLFATQASLGPQALARIRDQKLLNSPEGLARSLRGGGTGSMAPLHDRLARLDTPALFLAGGLDAKYRAIAHELAQLTPAGEARVIDRAGHAAHLERPVDVARSVATFVASL
ncbi:MAG: 2-succinyl-6-hydroxy-2,4-cyclohexadiene-1-carboxylate synthase [Acidimicrobiales bacterium]